MKRPAFELADIIRMYKTAFQKTYPHHAVGHKVLHALEQCRTAALGGHIDACDSCGNIRISYNSCRNRHCPKCQSINRERWIYNRTEDLLPCTYFHVVFTIPEQINTWCMQFPTELYNILFAAASDTIEVFSRDRKYLGAQAGMIALLHTWGQNLTLHPHIHMIVPGGGVTPSNQWKVAKSKGKFLFPVKAMSVVFRAKFMQSLIKLLNEKDHSMDVKKRDELYRKSWVVYAKQPFDGPQGVIEYLGRYTHKVAISNHSIKSIEDGKVSFQYKDYRRGGEQSIMTLSSMEFLRRFCLHILPKGFRKIRHYGFLANRNRNKLRWQQKRQGVITQAKTHQDWQQICKEKLHFDVDVCPCCNKGKMIRRYSFDANAPPDIALMPLAPFSITVN